jgi:hypothetical protein
MSDGRIKAGDLVMVVKPPPCVGGAPGVGHVFWVIAVTTRDDTECCNCGGNHGDVELALERPDQGWETWRLQRLDPPSETVRRLTKLEIEA